jgi:hypothetical protein
LNHTGKSVEALVIAQDALALSERTFGESHDVTFRGLITLFYVQEQSGDLATAEKTAQKMLDVSRRVRGEDHVDTLRARFMLANVWLSQGRDNEAGELLIKLLADYERVFGPDSVATSDVRTTLAVVYESTGNMRAAGAESRRALAAYVATLGPEHRTVFTVKNNMAILLRKSGELEESEKAGAGGARRAQARARSRGSRHGQLVEHDRRDSRVDEGVREGAVGAGGIPAHLARGLRRRSPSGDVDAVQPGRAAAQTRRLRRRGARVPRAARARLASARSGVGQRALRLAAHRAMRGGSRSLGRGEKIARDTLAVRDRTAGPGSNAALLLRSVLGRSLLAQEKLDEAEACLLAAWQGFNKNERADLIEDEQLREAARRALPQTQSTGEGGGVRALTRTDPGPVPPSAQNRFGDRASTAWIRVATVAARPRRSSSTNPPVWSIAMKPSIATCFLFTTVLAGQQGAALAQSTNARALPHPPPAMPDVKTPFVEPQQTATFAPESARARSSTPNVAAEKSPRAASSTPLRTRAPLARVLITPKRRSTVGAWRRVQGVLRGRRRDVHSVPRLGGAAQLPREVRARERQGRRCNRRVRSERHAATRRRPDRVRPWHAARDL